MYTTLLSLPNIETVKDFVCLANQFDFPIQLSADKYQVNAKSIMGIFSLDLTKPVQLQVEDEYCSDSFLHAIEQYETHAGTEIKH